MPRYRNDGVQPFRRDDGTRIATGESFDATAREHDRIKRRAAVGKYSKLLHLEDSSAIAEGAQKSGGSEVENPFVDDDGVAWPLEMTPDRYLKLHPSSQHSDLARRIMAKIAKASDGGGLREGEAAKE